MNPWPATRKDFLRWIAGLPLAAMAEAQSGNPLTVPGKRPMLVHNDFPEVLESPLEAFDSWLTPLDAFFVRQHLPRPKVDLAAWKLAVDGQVEKELSLSLEQLKAMPMHTVPATLECTGNGRGYFKPAVPGLQWKKGGIGNAEWRGVRLSDVLAQAKAKAGANFVDADGADKGVAKTPDYIRSISMKKALLPGTIVALEMNGQPVPEIHGGPLRLVVPGWNGANWIKWLNRLTVASEMNNAFYMNPAYRYPKRPVAPGTAVKPEDLALLETMPVKSFIVNPTEGHKHGSGSLEIRGVAWAGERKIMKVEVSVDRGITWNTAQLGKENFDSSFRMFRYNWKPAAPGYHLLMSRATDSAGATQPIDAAWNPSGYLWNSIDRVGVVVEG